MLYPCHIYQLCSYLLKCLQLDNGLAKASHPRPSSSSNRYTSDLVSSILSPSGISAESPFLHEALEQWSAEFPMPPEDHRDLDDLLHEHHFSTLLNSCLLSVASSDSGVWLSALLVPSLGTKLDNESLRIALGLRLGVPIVVEHTCVCGGKWNSWFVLWV